MAALALAQQSIFADEEIPVRAFFVGELEKHLLALRILEPFAVPFEELV